MLVFVYGTLKKGQGNHGLLERNKARFLGQVLTDPKYTMIKPCPSWPGVIKGGNTRILGEVYEVDSLNPLDYLEGFNEKRPDESLFYREQILTQYGSAWIYIFNHYEPNKVYEKLDGVW